MLIDSVLMVLMYILSATFSSTTFLTPRVCSSLSSNSRLRLLTLRSSSRRSSSSSACPCSFYSSSKVRAMSAEMVKDKEEEEPSLSAEMVKDKEEEESSLSAVESAQRRETKHSRTFLNVTSEAELLSAIRMEAEAGRLPSNVASGMEELYQNYKNAVLSKRSKPMQFMFYP